MFRRMVLNCIDKRQVQLRTREVVIGRGMIASDTSGRRCHQHIQKKDSIQLMDRRTDVAKDTTLFSLQSKHLYYISVTVRVFSLTSPSMYTS